jgi:hypothetical protein
MSTWNDFTDAEKPRVNMLFCYFELHSITLRSQAPQAMDINGVVTPRVLHRKIVQMGIIHRVFRNPFPSTDPAGSNSSIIPCPNPDKTEETQLDCIYVVR